MRVGIIGAGKIGSAIISGLNGCFHEDIEIIASGRSDSTLRNIEKLGGRPTRSNTEVVSTSDLIFLSVKPYHFPTVVADVPPDVWGGKTVVSIMAGVRLRTLRELLPGAKVFRAMPNINALVQMSATAVAPSEMAGSDEGLLVGKALACLGSVRWVSEELLDVWTGLVGSGPAFLAEVIDALVLGAVATGMRRDVAYEAVLDVMLGTAKLLKSREGKHLLELRDEVTTPAGTTIEGLKTLEREGVKAGLIGVVEAAVRRSKEIGEEIDTSVMRAAKNGGN
ncbi:MAG: pyrroline-5-carboxylate reductase [Desulfurococcales archaeon]|nr:pyrroline-5-carboxylate reductase [Desulfurococcales archaeon]